VALSPPGFFALITKFSCLNAYCSQRCNSLGAPQLMPFRPARPMQPYMTARLGPERQQWISRAIPTAAADAAAGHRLSRIAVEPFDHAAGKCLGFRVEAQQNEGADTRY
jgi:hypothetical protein